MKRRLLAWALTLCVLLGLCTTSVFSEDAVYFTAVDVNMLELNDETMPFWSGGYLYVDSTIFANLATTYGTMNYSRNIPKQTMALYTTKELHALVFYLDSGKTVDGDGRAYHAPAIVKGDVVFIPLMVVASFFDMRCSTIAVNHGTLVRLTADQNPILNDAAFVDAATNWIEVRYNEYIKSKTPTTPTPETINPVTPPTEINSQTIRLAFAVTPDAPAAAWLSTLNQANGQATFCFTPEAMDGDLLRQMQVQGHQIGLMADGSLETPVLEQLTQGNQRLFQATTTITRLVWLDNVEDVQPIIDAGYCPITAQVDVSEVGILTSNGATITMARIDTESARVTVWLGESTSSSGLSALLRLGAKSKDQFQPLTLGTV